MKSAMMTPSNPNLSIVCPMYCEEDSLGPFFARLLPALQKLEDTFEIVCVDDGSKDATLARLIDYQNEIPQLRVLELSRNFGKEAALTCGIDHARGQAVIPIDADLQDPPELITELVQAWRKGFEVVLAQRVNREADTLPKRKTAQWFYQLNNAISDNPIPANVGDFRLMDRKVVDALKRLPERQRFMKGLFAWVGFKQAIIPYTREPRAAGTGKFRWWQLWNFALDGIFSFSTTPLRIWIYLGMLIASSAFIYASFIVGRTIWLGRDIPGYASLITAVLFLGGIHLVGLGVLGEYIGRIYGEVKGRPIYIIREAFNREP
jgi:glycosyltransferase involved in cell wall biosynthesis